MSKKRLILGLFSATSVDVANGLLVGACLCYARLDFQMIVYVICVVLALLPDLDILLYMAKSDALDGGHRKSPLHTPSSCIPLVCLSILLLNGGKFDTNLLQWIVASVCCLTLHFMHDSIDAGGIRWLDPLTKNSYQLVLDDDGNLSIRVWSEEELDKTGTPKLAEWLETNHLRVTGQSVFGWTYLAIMSSVALYTII